MLLGQLRQEQLLVRLRPAEGAASTQQWAHAAALMQLGPQVAAELSAQLVTLGALPSVGGEGMPVAGVQCLALALRTLEAATLGEGGRLLEQEVRRRLHGGGQEAVACAGAALAHCLEIVDTPLGGAPRPHPGAPTKHRQNPSGIFGYVQAAVGVRNGGLQDDVLD